MKIATRITGRFIRLGLAAATLLLAQQALAIGTDPGVVVDNQATVSYNVAGNAQTPVDSNAVQFLVDRRVDFTVTRVGVGLTPVSMTDTQVWVEFLVQNLSNGDLDFALDFTQLVPADGDIYPGQPDSGVDMTNVSISVSAASDPAPGGGPDPVFGGPSTINDLPEDEYIRVRIYADPPATAVNGDISGLSLDVTAADPAGPDGSDPLEESAIWNAGAIDNVFANASGGTETPPASGTFYAIESDIDGFLISSAALVITKSQAVDSGPFGGDRALPGAIIEYTIEIENTGTVGATSISISDLIDADVTFVTDAYNGGASNIEFDRGLPGNSFCLADAADGNSDGCTLTGATLTIAGRDDSVVPITAIDVAAGQTVTINFMVEIPAT